LLAQREIEKYPEVAFVQLTGKEELIPAVVRRWHAFLAGAEHRSDPVFTPWIAFSKLQDDEFAKFNGEKYKYSGGYDEIIHSEWIDFNYPKDLKNETLRTYFDKLINKVVNKIIKPNDYKFDEFLNYMNQQ
jgi:hypothetical protein